MIGRMVKWNLILEEIKKCEVRCANCHRIKTANQFGFEKLKWSNSMVNDKE